MNCSRALRSRSRSEGGLKDLQRGSGTETETEPPAVFLAARRRAEAHQQDGGVIYRVVIGGAASSCSTSSRVIGGRFGSPWVNG